MLLKKFEAATMSQALKKIKAELGKDAVIFSTKNISAKSRPGRVKPSSWVEVTAAVERSGARAGQKHAGAGAAQLPSSLSRPASRGPGANAGAITSFADGFSPCLQSLLDAGFSQDMAWYLLGESNADYQREGGSGNLYDFLLKKVALRLPVNGPISLNPVKRKTVALIGPTGVGKTTTLAKIAAYCLRSRRMKVKFITLDTYRIAAVEQLKIYGKIMGIPVEVAASPQELAAQIHAAGDYNLVLIDTAGRNFKDREQIAELSSCLHHCDDIETHLLLSATTSENVLQSIVQCIDRNVVDRLIFTKLDEGVTLGHLFNVAVSQNIPISYVTTGQRVPEDIRPASAGGLSKMLCSGYAH